MAEPIRVLIVDDQALLREGFRRLLELEGGSDITIVGAAGDGQAALDLIAQLNPTGQAPDVALMDVRMPRLDGVQATAQLRARFPQVRVLILTTFDDEDQLVAGLRAGAKGYLLKDTTAADLIAAIRAVYRGESPIQPSVAAKLVQRVARQDDAPIGVAATNAPGGPRSMDQVMIDELTEREREIVRELARGASNREISEKLFITEGTVKNHVSNILNKLGLRDRTQAAIYAREHGLG
jgi:DNA-binding NarL/FixJ family response regulator